MGKKAEKPDLTFFDSDWKKIECSKCGMETDRKTTRYYVELAGVEINQSYWNVHTVCKHCRIKNIIYMTENQIKKRG